MEIVNAIPAEELEPVRRLLPRCADDLDLPEVQAEFPMHPVDAPGVGRPGRDLDRAAREAVGPLPALRKVPKKDGPEKEEAIAANARASLAYSLLYEREILHLYTRVLYDPEFELTIELKGRRVQAPTAPGGFRTYRDDDGTAARVDGWGPRRARVMVVGTCPGAEEVARGENFVGKASEPLTRAMAELGLDGPEAAEWYWTSLVKHPYVDPAARSFSAAQVNNMLPLLRIEMRLVEPDFVLCLGAPATKSLLGAKQTVDKMFGRTVDLEFPLHDKGRPPRHHRARAMAIIHPASVAHHPETYGDLVIGLRAFRDLVRGDRSGDLEPDVRHVNVHTEAHLERVVDAIVAESTGVDIIAVDAEWHGDRPGEPGSYLRTIQFSARHKEAFTVVLRGQGGRPTFAPSPDSAQRHLKRLLKSTDARKVRVGGHFFSADFPWLAEYGLRLGPEYAVADTPALTRTAGGWDTYKMVHAYMEQVEGGLKLENLLARFCGIPRYDADLQAWKQWFCRTHQLKDKDLGGYGECPESVLHSSFPAVAPNYSAYDADGCRRLMVELNGVWGVPGTPDKPGLLDCDRNGNDCRSAFWHAHAATPAILEMESTGLAVDRTRGDEVTDAFIVAYDKLLAAFRTRINWVGEVVPKFRRKGGNNAGLPTTTIVLGGFNPSSANQCRELLFGVKLNGAIDKVTGECRRLSPEGAGLMALPPVVASGDRPEPWDRVVSRGEVGVFWPATNRESLGILSHMPGEDGKTVKMLRDLRFLAQALKGTLRRPWLDADGLPATARDDETDEEFDGGRRIYDGGLMYHMNRDGQVRTHFGLVETGRWSSWGPNFQNISKRREEDYARILGKHDYDKKAGAWEPKGDYLKEYGSPQYRFPIRSILEASPGRVLVEADYKMAEMAIIGWLADDPTMIEHVRRNTLDESDPDYLDLHSLTAITAFGLDTPQNRQIVRAKIESGDPKWKGLRLAPDGSLVAAKLTLAALGRKALRVAAKNVNFGVPYGRSAAAIARQCREEGADVSVEEAQALIDAYKKANYPQIAAFLDRCAARVLEPGWMVTPFGRYRRFSPSDDETKVAEMQRQAMNFCIQSSVADAVSLACRNLHRLRVSAGGVDGSTDRWFKFCVQIHDALLFEVPIPALGWFLDDVLEEGMSTSVDIWPTDLDGVRLPGIERPYHLATDSEVMRYWGEPLDREWALAQGIPEHTPGGIELVPAATPKPPKLNLPERLSA